MKKLLFYSLITVGMFSCNNDKGDQSRTATTAEAAKPAEGLPYTPSYSSSWSTDVSDADLKMVLMTYKDWSDGNMAGLEKIMGDSLSWDNPNGDHFSKPKTDIIKLWTSYRDSLSSVKIDMEGWNKMYATDKKDGFVVTWYKETDTFKGGKVDSAFYHDINMVKDGKLVWLSQYKRPAK